jgi:hypothetical protein
MLLQSNDREICEILLQSAEEYAQFGEDFHILFTGIVEARRIKKNDFAVIHDNRLGKVDLESAAMEAIACFQSRVADVVNKLL